LGYSGAEFIYLLPKDMPPLTEEKCHFSGSHAWPFLTEGSYLCTARLPGLRECAMTLSVHEDALRTAPEVG
jgi:hypothetical protein